MQPTLDSTQSGPGWTFPALVSRAGFVLVLIGGALLGLAAPSLALGRPWLLWFVAGGAALAATLYLFADRKLRSAVGLRYYLGKGREVEVSGSRPRARDLLWGTWAAIFPMSTAGMAVFALYGFGFGVAWLINLSIGWFGGAARLPMEAVGFYFSVFALVVYGLGFIVVGARALAEWVYVSELRQRDTAFTARGELLPQFARSLMGAAVFVALAGYLFFETDWGRLWPLLAVQIGLVAAANPAWELVQVSQKRSATRSASEVVGRLLAKAGFEIEHPALTSDSDAAPLLRKLDFVARRGTRSLAVQVKTAADSSKPVNWTAASSLNMAAWALGSEQDGLPAKAEPLLVLVDVAADESLYPAGEKEGVRIVRTTQVALAQAAEAAVDADLSDAAAEFLSSLTLAEGD
jgi:hypothetical protein